MSNNVMPISIENARIIFRNFSGKGSQYNREGNRNFAVIIDDPKTAEELSSAGWNVRYLEPREDGDTPTAYLKVSVRFENVPPKIYSIAGKTKTELSADVVGELDYADIASCDMVITPYYWEVNEKSGIKAYLKKLYVVLNEDPFARKYESDISHSDEEDLPF